MNSKQVTVISVLMGVNVLFCGCEGFRYAATEAQKQNAWLHREVCADAERAAVDENASQRLCDLTALAHDQSTAFVLDYGLPEQSGTGFQPVIAGADNVIDEHGAAAHGQDVHAALAQAQADSLRKPDMFELADGALDLGIALAGLIGGVYGIRIAGYLKTAREKSRALKEIVAGNELFKQLWPEHAGRFKDAQQKQSPTTKQIVTELKVE